MSDQDTTQTPEIIVTPEALQAALNEMTNVYGLVSRELAVCKAVLAEQHRTILSLEAQLAALKAAATPGTVVQLDPERTSGGSRGDLPIAPGQETS